MFSNPHKKHGYVTGDTGSPFYVAMEMVYRELSDRAQRLDFACPQQLAKIVFLQRKYEILRQCVYWGNGGSANARAQLESAISRVDLYGDEITSGSKCEASSIELLRQATKDAIADLRGSYKN